MSNDSTAMSALPANAADELDAFAEAAATNLQSSVGALLTYKKRRYLFGKEKAELPLGTELVAIMNEVRHGHLKWVGGKVVKPAIGRVVNRYKPDRDALGDNDESQWPFDFNGKQSDPWQKTVLIPLVTRDGATVFTFSTHSFFGREAAYKLLAQYAEQARQHPNCYPVVKLGTTTNPTKKYGDIDSPQLLIVGWQDRPQQVLPATAIVDDLDKPSDSHFGKVGKVDLDDEIPF